MNEYYYKHGVSFPKNSAVTGEVCGTFLKVFLTEDLFVLVPLTIINFN